MAHTGIFFQLSKKEYFILFIHKDVIVYTLIYSNITIGIIIIRYVEIWKVYTKNKSSALATLGGTANDK